MTNPSRRVAGIDTGKAHLEIAVHRRSARWRVENTPQGWALLITHLRAEGVSLIGIEATGGYERGVVEALRAAGLRVVVHQPLQIKAFAKMRLRRAKNDRLDAALIAAFTDLLDPERAEREPPDPRLAPLADRLVFIEQAHEDSARAILRLEHQPDPRLRAQLEEDECRAKERARRELKALVADIRAHHPDLAHRLELLIPGIGLPAAVHLVVQMPELGRTSREEAAALSGLAPFDDDTGQHSGERHIMGGRAQVRTALYAAALPASYRWNPALMALRNRLRANGKPHRKALVAVARKLLVYANAVLARGTPWCEHAPARAAG